MSRWSDDAASLYRASPALLARRGMLGAGWLGIQRSAHTRRSYEGTIRRFAAWLEAPDAEEAGFYLVSLTAGEAVDCVEAWMAALRGEGLAPATINRHLATLASFVTHAYRRDLCGWLLKIDAEPLQPEPGTRDGPSEEEIAAMLAVCQGSTEADVRNRAILLTLYTLGLREGEACALDWSDLDVPGSRLAIVGKGYRDPVVLGVPPRTLAALLALRRVRGMPGGAVFVSVDLAHPGHRLTGDGMRRIIARLAKRAGINHPVRPHGLRHAGATKVARTTHDVALVQAWGRWRRADTALGYVHRSSDLQREMAELVAGGAAVTGGA